MSCSEEIQAVLLNWNDEEFKKLHDPEFMFIRETELMTMDDWIANMKEWRLSKEIKPRPQNIVSSRKQICDRVALGRRRRTGYSRLHEEKRTRSPTNSLPRNNRRFPKYL